MRLCITALVLSLFGSLGPLEIRAQEGTQLGPAPLPGLVNPAEPEVAPPAEELVPNPFRELNAPSNQPGEPGFAEATDQNLQAPSSQTLPPAFSQPTPSPIPRSTAASSASTASSSRSNNSFSPRLARAAPIMGDSLSPTIQFVDDRSDIMEGDAVASFPTAGGATRRKIGENTGAFPTDRLFFNYHSFQNGVESFGEAGNIDRFTLGGEKTFLDGLFSIDLRLPLSGETDVHFFDPGRGGTFSRNGSELGNLSVGLKALLTSDENSALVAGLVVDTPTGGAVDANLLGTSLKFGNDAVHLAPFIGFLFLQDSGLTHQGFVQVDVATNGNEFTFNDGIGIVNTEFMEQTLLYVDYGLSKAIYTGSRNSTLQRLTVLTELHYTTTLEDSDTIVVDTTNLDPTNGSFFTLSSQGNRIDVLNFTAGLDTMLSCGANFRVGTVVPLTDGDDRFFDIEFLAQVNFVL